jgi:hypothetical protein
VQTRLNDKFYELDEKYAADQDYQVLHIRKSELKKFATDFSVVYNKAWASHQGNKQITKEVAYKMFQAMKPVMDEHLIWYVYHRNEPIAFWVNLPELNQIFKHLDGSFNFLAKLKYLWLKRKGICNKFTGIVFGVIPEYQGKGIDYYMIVQGAKVIQEDRQYDELEMQWQGDFNPKILNISRNIGATKSRILATYRYLFDRSKEFKRHPILN